MFRGRIERLRKDLRDMKTEEPQKMPRYGFGLLDIVKTILSLDIHHDDFLLSHRLSFTRQVCKDIHETLFLDGERN